MPSGSGERRLGISPLPNEMNPEKTVQGTVNSLTPSPPKTSSKLPRPKFHKTTEDKWVTWNTACCMPGIFVGVWHICRCDLLGRQSSVTAPGTTTNPGGLLTTLYQYDTANDKVTVVHPDTTTSVTLRDDLGRTVSSTNENLETTTYTYFRETSWMTTLTDARSKVTTWTHNDLGQLLTKTYPGGTQTDTYTYDSVQRLHTHTRPSGKMATYGYDLRDRVATITWSGAGLYGSGENQTFTYYDDGRPNTRSNGLATTSHTYLPNGDLDEVTQAHHNQTWVVGYQNDDAGRLTRLTYPASTTQETVDFRYNLRGQLDEVYNPNDGTTAPLATYERRADGLVSKLFYDNNAHTRFDYDAGKRSTKRVHHRNNGQWMDTNNYAYDLRSRRIAQSWSGNTGDRYQYDPAGQLVKAFKFPDDLAQVLQEFIAMRSFLGGLSLRNKGEEAYRSVRDPEKPPVFWPLRR